MVQIFIASSSEQLPIARQIETALREPEVSSVKLWDEAFDFSQHCMDSLEVWLDRADFAVVVLTGDDSANVRQKATVLPRDNAIFELGLFMGRLGRSRCFFFVEGESATQIASDLTGINYVKFYREDVAGGPGKPSLRTVCDRLKTQILNAKSDPVRYKPTPAIREQQVELWRFVSSIEGHWWQRIGDARLEAPELTYLTLRLDPVTNAPVMSGETYDQRGNSTGSWKALACVASGVKRGEKAQVDYHWTGEHERFLEYGGQGVITFDALAPDVADGHFWKTHLRKAADGARTGSNAFRLYRCSVSDEIIMKPPFSAKARDLVVKRLKTLSPPPRRGSASSKVD